MKPEAAELEKRERQADEAEKDRVGELRKNWSCERWIVVTIQLVFMVFPKGGRG